MKKLKGCFKWIFNILVIFGFASGIFFFVEDKLDERQAEKISQMTPQQKIEHLLSENPDAIITIGKVNNGQQSYEVYGAEKKAYTYEIGSISKTMTAALVEQAVLEGKIDLNAEIDVYLDLNPSHDYPTIQQLLTHTSGYPSVYRKLQMFENVINDDNAYYNIGREVILEDIQNNNLSNQKEAYTYSNFGYATLGLVLEKVYGEKYIHLVNRYLSNLGFEKTNISTEFHDLDNYERFTEDDGYLPAGQVTSNVEEMMDYIAIQLERNHAILEENITEYPELKHIGYAWVKHDNGIIWHNGGTAHFNSFLAFHPETQSGIIVLVNTAIEEDITATSIGNQMMLDCIEKQ